MPPDRWSTDPRLNPKPVSGHSERMRVAAGSAALRREPDGSAEQVNQALFGEPVRVLEREGEWAYVQLGLDHYVGWTLVRAMRSGVFQWTAKEADDWRLPWLDWPGTRYEAKAKREGRTPSYLTFERQITAS